MNHIVAVVGMAGSGKTTVAKIAQERGYGHFRFGQITIDGVRERGLDLTPENERIVREAIRAEHGGNGAYAIKAMPIFKELLEKGNVIADGLYSWSEYKILKEEFGDGLIVLGVHVPPEERYRRLEARKSDGSVEDKKTGNNRTITRVDAVKRDYTEIEGIEKGGPIAMADHMIVNTKPYDEYVAEINAFFDSVVS